MTASSRFCRLRRPASGQTAPTSQPLALVAMVKVEKRPKEPAH